MEIQLDLFQDMSEEALMKAEIALLREELGNLRRGIFARHNELMKFYLEQQEEILKLRENVRKD